MTMPRMMMSTTSDEATEILLADLVERYVDRIQLGDTILPDEFAADYPSLEADLLTLLPAAAAMGELRHSLIEDTTSPGLESSVLGDYRILREVGRGGMGVVYEAEQISLGRRVALKVLPNASAMDPRQLARFRIEAQAAAALHHPHIVPIFAVGCDQGVHYYAMQFIEGCSLAEILAQGRSKDASPKLDPREAARLAWETALALDHAHSLGILHRDVKPANLLIDPSGHLWVTDFGLARFLDGVELTRTGDVIGTLRYLSPEQANGRRAHDPRSDVYGLGATLYELLTLRPAFDGRDRRELLRQIADEEPIAARKIDPSIPRDLETILSRAMAKEPNARYGLAVELAYDLRRFLDNRPILARRPGLAERLGRWARRHRSAMLTASAVLAAAVVSLAIGAGLLWREQTRTRDNLKITFTALDEFCLSTSRMNFARDPERAQEIRDLQDKSLAIYERVLSENPDDPEARWAAARAHHRVANFLAASQSPLKPVEQAYQAAESHLTRLQAAFPEGRRYREEMIDVLGDWGAFLSQKKPEAQGLLRRALAGHRQLATEYPGEVEYRKAVGRDCLELSKTIGISLPAEAEEKERLQRKSVEIRKTLQDGSFAARADLAESYGYLGHLLDATVGPAEGSQVMNLAREIVDALDREFATDPDARRRTIELRTIFTFPRYCNGSANSNETVDACRDLLLAKAKLVTEFPSIPDFLADLAWTHRHFSGLLNTMDRRSEAESEARRALKINERLLKDHPTVSHYRLSMALTCEHLGTLLVKSRRSQSALPYYRKALEACPEDKMMKDHLNRAIAACEAPRGQGRRRADE